MLLQATYQNTVIDTGDRFMITLGESDSYLAYRIYPHAIDLYCAYVPQVSWGNGHACSLILHALQYAVLNGLRVEANCKAVAEYFRRNPEWCYILVR